MTQEQFEEYADRLHSIRMQVPELDIVLDLGQVEMRFRNPMDSDRAGLADKIRSKYLDHAAPARNAPPSSPPGALLRLLTEAAGNVDGDGNLSPLGGFEPVVLSDEMDELRTQNEDELEELRDRLEAAENRANEAESRAEQADAAAKRAFDERAEALQGAATPVAMRFLVSDDPVRDQIVRSLDDALSKIEDLEPGTEFTEIAQTFVAPFIALSIGALELRSGSIQRLAQARSQVLIAQQHLERAHGFFARRDAVVDNLIADALWALGTAVAVMVV